MPTLEEIRAERRRRQEAARHRDAIEYIEASKERCRTLSGFIREAWHIIEPINEYKHGWHIDAVSEHLTAVTNGNILRLLMNIPPGTMKSLLTSVFWPAWEWGPMSRTHLRYFTTSYSDRYVVRDTRRMRDLVMSDWFQDRWPDVQLIRTGESSFENTLRGWREGVPFKSMTGGRGDRVVIDDPHSTESAESELERETTTRIFRESVTSRLIDPELSAIIVMMQRLHAMDVSGVILKEYLGDYVHLMLPMEFEPDRKCYTSIGFEDPRTKEGELLFEARFPRHVVDRDKRAMGSYAVAGQFQQRPTVREGGLFKRNWFKPVGAAPAGTRWVRYWDIAATDEQLGTTAAWTAGVKLGRTPEGRFIVGDVARLRAEGHGVRRLIKDTAKDDGPYVEIGLPQDPGAAGKIVAQDMVLMLAGYVAKAHLESGDKVSRAEPIAAQAEAGNVDIVTGTWNEDFLDEACNFPGGDFKDQVDALSGAFSRLIGGSLFSEPEVSVAMPAVRIQAIWPRVCAIEVTNTLFAAVWVAFDRMTGTMMIYDTYRAPRVGFPIHAAALRKRGPWVPALFDLESRGRSKDEGLRIGESLMENSVDIFTVPLDLEAGVVALADRLQTKRLRAFETQTDWFDEYRRFRRDEKGELVDQNDELIRCTALIANHGEGLAITENRAASDARGYDPAEDIRGGSSTGY